jgi:PAP2 superfamily
MTGALLIAWACRPLGLTIRAAAWAYAGVTAFATLGSGQHYLVDLIVAVPFACGIDLALRPETRWRAVGFLGIVAVWTFLLREAGVLLASTPSLTIGLAIVAVASPVLNLRRSQLSHERGAVLTPAT